MFDWSVICPIHARTNMWRMHRIVMSYDVSYVMSYHRIM